MNTGNLLTFLFHFLVVQLRENAIFCSLFHRICAGCNNLIDHGRFLSSVNAVWHPECFRCHACNLVISDFEVESFSVYDIDVLLQFFHGLVLMI